ncbi:hypothetical protein SPOG_05708 [Schizosaccharomyces cryophilus OY26]|uniref:Integrase catalytic domain-containing protein n=1 Tax=Schizosaccharomyces cryophilus (strain OY26 / ATCC MYA-4695 / CBS 11777 / NBRC 106824 / NRRL Y48691) TaxID=653667 RepID=S9W0W2_SCHCR|nr:uncharacterized protein SPOG_05708 [Schizosaccharomyces cryophilus OY26]EPY53508.1 hypothetical protein SPOG_05708 [Schizosaccharomyces cryophilus OY26]
MLFSGYHPQTNGQTERVNQILESYLRCYVNKHLTNWVNYLLKAQLCYNSSQHSATKIAPINAAFGIQAIVTAWDTQILDELDIPYLPDRTESIDEIRERNRKANDKYAKYYNQKTIPPPIFQPNDQVLVKNGKVRFFHQSSKLEPTFVGPFSVKRKIGEHNYELNFPKTIRRRYPASFHVSELEPYNADSSSNNFTQNIIIDEILDADNLEKPSLYNCLYRAQFSKYDYRSVTWVPRDIVRKKAYSKLIEFTRRASPTEEPQ